MTKFGVGIFLLALLSGALQAQVTVDITLEKEQFLPDEAMPMAVRITNRTGRTLRLGSPDDWLTFAVEVLDNPGEVVVQTGEVPVSGEFDLESGKVAIKRVNLAPYFDLSKQGKYSVSANLRISSSQQIEIVTHGKSFYIADGARMWEREFGIPNAAGGTNEIRKYMLQQSVQIKGKLQLYLRITDARATKTFKLQPIGTLLSFSHPDPQLDRDSNLHLLYQSGPTLYSYAVFNPNGDLLIRQLYEIGFNSRPRLRGDEQGNIRINGGIRRETKMDFPPKVESSTPSTDKTPETPAALEEKPMAAPAESSASKK